ncbi:mitochondrial import inner membrane translocase subunit Tim29 [Patella vulgata]|uniref:mitochondrial import inner membrane translocase subunit Tim29 n=1 Tax=Patella vulgata TaxID=6465 RepID=UPI00217FAC49|nr:mitochondrial import inner membrane translocase subunit Tim29 [Patella vulgata]
MSKIFNGAQLAQSFTKKVKIPDKLKGGRMEKIGNYFHNIYTDYKMVFIELGEDMKAKPLKSSIYCSILAASAVLFKTNPSENSFRTLMVESANDLALVGDPIRNTSSDNYMQNLINNHKDGRVHYVSLGLFSLIYLTDYRNSLGLYAAKCKYVKPRWSQFHKSILDVGVFGRWIYTEEAMKDYDVNPEEWVE